MTVSVDTNVLFAAVQAGDTRHAAAAGFLTSLAGNADVTLSELVLFELYQLLRNPAVVARPLNPLEAVDVCDRFRRHPRWQIVGLPPNSRAFHDLLWPRLATAGFARRRAFDWRVALSLQLQGVDEFATANVKDFEGLGFARVWDPLAG